VVQEGRVLESGDHASLIASPDGVYAKLFARQAEGYQEDPAPTSSGAAPGGAAPSTVAAG
jgi:ATP-binding cassette subfamily B protein